MTIHSKHSSNNQERKSYRLTDDDVDAIIGDDLIAADDSALDRPLKMTKFFSPGADTKKDIRKSLRAFKANVLRPNSDRDAGIADPKARNNAAKEKLPWIKLATFGDKRTGKNCLRHDENMLSIDGVEGDYDGGEVPIEKGAALLRDAGLAALVFTSPSHTPEKPRWRVLCPTSRTLPVKERAPLVAILNGVLGGILSRESHADSQSYFYGKLDNNPAHHAIEVDGSAIDVRPDLASRAIAKGAMDAAKAGTTADLTKRPPVDELALFDQITSAETFHVPCLQLAGLYANQGVSQKEARDRLATLFDGVAKEKRDSRWKARKTDAFRCVRDVYLKDARQKKEKAERETEDALALAFIDRWHKVLRFDHRRGKWYHFKKGLCWQIDESRFVLHLVREFLREHSSENRSLARLVSARNVEQMASIDRRVEVTSDWDSEDFLIGTPAGTVDLRTGELRAAKRSDFITKLTTVAPDPDFISLEIDAPHFHKFIHEVTGNDESFIRYLRQWFGYCLTGSTRVEELLFLWGPGGNGKSKLIELVAHIMGPYAVNAGMRTFMATKNSDHIEEIARFDGARLITASETRESATWDEVRIKELTGSKRITAHFMRENSFEMIRRFKLCFSGNNEPNLDAVDTAMKRRLNIAHFTFTPTEIDEQLAEKLQAESSAVFAWLILGCVDWQENGFVKPACMVETTNAYFKDQGKRDVFSNWFSACVEVTSNHDDSVMASVFWDSWIEYARAADLDEPEKYLSRNRAFPMKMQQRGLKIEIVNRGSRYSGARLRREKDDSDDV